MTNRASIDIQYVDAVESKRYSSRQGELLNSVTPVKKSKGLSSNITGHGPPRSDDDDDITRRLMEHQ